MSTVTKKRSVMCLYTSSIKMDSHSVRIVLAEKGVPVNIIEVDRYGVEQSDIFDINPYNTTPTLIDRDLILYNYNIVMEYLDERFPHPSLLPVYPIKRAEFRKMIYRIDRDWYSLVDIIQKSKDVGKKEKAREMLKNGILSIVSLLSEYEYFLSDNFSLIDCCFAPLLWRLPSLGIKLDPKLARPLLNYSEKIFQRKAFKESLTDSEQELEQIFTNSNIK